MLNVLGLGLIVLLLGHLFFIAIPTVKYAKALVGRDILPPPGWKRRVSRFLAIQIERCDAGARKAKLKLDHPEAWGMIRGEAWTELLAFGEARTSLERAQGLLSAT